MGLRHPKHTTVSSCKGPDAAAWSAKIKSKGCKSRIATKYRPTVSDRSTVMGLRIFHSYQHFPVSHELFQTEKTFVNKYFVDCKCLQAIISNFQFPRKDLHCRNSLCYVFLIPNKVTYTIQTF